MLYFPFLAVVLYLWWRFCAYLAAHDPDPTLGGGYCVLFAVGIPIVLILATFVYCFFCFLYVRFLHPANHKEL